jgi:hypothetical protein
MKVQFLDIEKQWHRAFKLNFDLSEADHIFSLEFREAYFGCNLLLMRNCMCLYYLNDLGKAKLKEFFSKLSLYNWGEKQEGYNTDRRACSTVLCQLGRSYSERNYKVLEELGFVTISNVLNAAHDSESMKSTDQQKLFLWSVNKI